MHEGSSVRASGRFHWDDKFREQFLLEAPEHLLRSTLRDDSPAI